MMHREKRLRQQYVADKKKTKKKERLKRKRDEENGLEPKKPKGEVKTLDTLREKDETIVKAGGEEGEDVEVSEDIRLDAFSDYFTSGRAPKIVITTSNNKPPARIIGFSKLMTHIFSNAIFVPRRNYTLEEVTQYSINRDYTDLILVNDNRDTVTDVIISHLPKGPTAHFTVMDLVMPREIKGAGCMTDHPCELILNGFVTRLGVTVGRMLACLFSQTPDFKGRRVATFHNQRDFIFFRLHRYIFEESETEFEKSKGPVTTTIQEIGPRFTLKLRTLRLGNAADTHGEFLFTRKKDYDKTRRRFFL